ncbi:uncharacterized protein At1g76070-like [Humulus lupulus]|uniref:uncharacterized protein At1g76070-like n=1 Tax=Humulus lupulus TaxID=3486 RepID=UPI002B4074ED|nr:uncharacterized protein At1g76070-like [Humulus lupulus]
MEKLKKKIAKLLPQAVTFTSPPPSPRKAPTAVLLVSLVPAEARLRPNYGTSFDTKEPSSPKVSCLGHVTKPKSKPKPKPKHKPKQHKESLIIKIFKGHRRKGGKRCSVGGGGSKDGSVVKKVPQLGLMNKFESGRGGMLSDFDWTAHVDVLGPDSEKCHIEVESKKEVNLWERRNKPGPPPPLFLKM